MNVEQFEQSLDGIEDIADSGDLLAALAMAITLSDLPLTPVQAAEVKLLSGSLLARDAKFEEAKIDVLQAQQMCASAQARELGTECAITLASITAASGDYPSAIEQLKLIVHQLDDPKLAPADEKAKQQLKADALAELRSYTNLTSPKNQATWASMLKK